MIIAYYTRSLKYLQKDNYKKTFDVNSITELLNKIKIKDKVLIKASSKDIFDFKFSSDKKNIDFDIDYVALNEEESIEKPIFDYDMVEQDYKNDVAYALYPVAENWQHILGKEIYFCRDRAIQLYLVKEKDICTFLYSDMEKLKNDILTTGEIGLELVNKFGLTDEEIENEKICS